MPDQQRGLQAERKVGDQSTCPTGRRIRFVGGHGTRERAGRREVGVERCGLPPRQGHLRVERFETVGLSCQRSKYIEGDDVARPLPHRHDGLFAVAPRKRERFGVAVSAEALESFVGVLGTALADPVFRDRRRESSEGNLCRGCVGVVRPSESQCGRGCGFRFERKISDDGCHGGLVGEQPTEGGAVTHMPGGFGDGLAHPCRGPVDAVEPGARDHLDDGPHTAALLAEERTESAVELDLAGRVRPVSELVLQSLDAEHVALAILENPRHQEAAQSRRRLR